MCNKRRKVTKYNRNRRIIHSKILFLFLFLVFTACDSKVIYQHNFNTDEFEQYGEAVQERSYEKLIELTNSSDSDIVRLAWLALAKTSINEIDEFYSKVLEENSIYSWYALSNHQISEERLTEIKQLWFDEENKRENICVFLSRQGTPETVKFLTEQSDYLLNSYECSLAIGKITSRRVISRELQKKVAELAIAAESEQILKNLLYGFNRSRINNIRNHYQVVDILVPKWREKGIGIDQELDQFMMKITAETGMEVIVEEWIRGTFRGDEFFFVDFVQMMSEFEIYNLHPELYKRLLSGKNHDVVLITIRHLHNHEYISDDLLSWIEKEITAPTRDAEIFLSSLNLLQTHGLDLSPYYRKLDFTISDRPDLFNLSPTILKDRYSDDEYFELLIDKAVKDETIAVHALREIALKLRNNPEFFQDNRGNQLKDAITTIISNKYLKQSVLLETILANDFLYDNQEVMDLYSLFNDNEIEERRELYELFIKVIYRRGIEDYEQIFTELAERGDHRVNTLLNTIDKDIKSAPGNKFMMVNWSRLTELGSRPVWTLKTDIGTIEVKLDPLSAPFTVNAIDSLSNAGLFNGVPFHRVIANFVAQGGDYRLKNGTGSPGYYLPTEPVPYTIKRGHAGIASQGTDTESSQFFFTKQWVPHLDGNYTVFGKIIRGMDVVDNLRYGDKVISATVNPR